MTLYDLPVDCICFGFVTTKSHHREFRLNLTRIDLHDSDPGGNQLLPQRFREDSNCSLGGTIYRPTGIALSACDAPDIDDVSSSAFISLLEDLKHRLGHQSDKPRHYILTGVEDENSAQRSVYKELGLTLATYLGHIDESRDVG